MLRNILLLATAATALSHSRAAYIDDAYASEEDDRLRQAVNRISPAHREPFHPGPGIHDDFYPLFTTRESWPVEATPPGS